MVISYSIALLGAQPGCIHVLQEDDGHHLEVGEDVGYEERGSIERNLLSIVNTIAGNILRVIKNS